MLLTHDWFTYASYYDRIAQHWAKLRRPVRLLEIGVFEGRSTCYLAAKLQELGVDAEFHACDLFVSHPDGYYFSDLPIGYTFRFIVEANLFEQKLLKSVQLHTQRGVDLLQSFADCYFDFIFLDGDHQTDNVLAEIRASLPRLKPTGILAGHDYNYLTVRAAVDASFPIIEYEGDVWEASR